MPFLSSAVRAATTGPSDESQRRCFICLTDEEASDPKGSWVDPCPCTLAAHQDCILSWVLDCERSNKPLKCPICKTQIQLEGPWDPIASLHDFLQRNFTTASPFILLTGVSVGVQFSLQMYGAVALWAFAGKKELLQFMFGSDAAGDPGFVRFAKQRIVNALILMNVGPTLLASHMLPGLSNKYFAQSASIYGVFCMIRNDNFLEWPPSPRLAMVAVPIMRRIYWNLWKDFVLPYEIRLNRQIVGLPPSEAPEDADGPANDRPPPERPVEGGLVGFLQNILEVLDPDDEDLILGNNNNNNNNNNNLNVPRGRQVVHANEHGDEIMVELVIEAGAQMDEPPQHQEPDNQREAAQAPPARRLGLGGLLSNVSNSIVGALLLPVVSFAMGEALRMVLPRSWTSTPGSRLSGPRPTGRPGLLQQQWGRSLIGGCLYVVLSDLLRVYSKSRKVAAMNNRRVKNADGKRRRPC